MGLFYKDNSLARSLTLNLSPKTRAIMLSGAHLIDSDPVSLFRVLHNNGKSILGGISRVRVVACTEGTADLVEAADQVTHMGLEPSKAFAT